MAAKAGDLLAVISPKGEVDLPNPVHTEPESDWPSESFYAYTVDFGEQTVVTVAVIDHPENPPTLWHNHRALRMLNPCITAPSCY